MHLVPRNADVKVSLGRWKPSGDETDPVQRMPKAETLKQASLWCDGRFKRVREMLRSPQLVVEVQCTADSAKVETQQGRRTIEVFRRTEGMPTTLSTLPFYAIILDLRDQTVDDVHLVASEG